MNADAKYLLELAAWLRGRNASKKAREVENIAMRLEEKA